MVVRAWKRKMQLFETRFDRFFEERQVFERGLQSEFVVAEEPGFGIAAGSEMDMPCIGAVVVELESLAAALGQDSLYTVVEVEHPGIR